MTIVLSEIDSWDLWQMSRNHSRQADPEDERDRIAECPSILGKGYKRDIELRNGIDLTFHHYQLKDDLVMNWEASGDTGCLEWVFTLSSAFRLPDGTHISQGQHLLAGLISPGGYFEGFGHAPTVEVDIHLEPERLQQFMGDQIDWLPLEVQRMLARDGAIPFSPVRNITPAMQIALQQMLECPFQGVIKQMYLESKSVEVLALWLDQARAHDSSMPPARSIEVERIYQAKEILLQQIDNPPSLLSLARQVGLNDCTLKRGFKQVFGTTVFNYLHQHRMEQARSLLRDRHLNVTEVARKVGYKNLSAFSTAFRKQFGVSPKMMQR